MTALETTTSTATTWTAVCSVGQLVPERGVAALVDGRQIALFRVDIEGETRIYAIDNYDPISHANVMARGIIGTEDDTIYVASPLKKERYDLETGDCLSVSGVSLHPWRVKIVDGLISIAR